MRLSAAEIQGLLEAEGWTLATVAGVATLTSQDFAGASPVFWTATDDVTNRNSVTESSTRDRCLADEAFDPKTGAYVPGRMAEAAERAKLSLSDLKAASRQREGDLL